MIPNNYKIVFHIGYPRTGSTYLKSIFKKQKEINYLSKYNDPYLAKAIDLLIMLDLHDLVKLKVKFKKIIEKIKFSKKKINVISEESFLDFSVNSNNTQYIIFKKINLLFEEEKFDKKYLVIIRNQKDLIISHYAKCFHNLILEKKKWVIFKNYLNDLRYDSIFNLYKFDKFFFIKKKYKINFMILPYEKLLINKNFFLKKIFNFIGITKFNIKNNIYTNKSIKKNSNYYIKEKYFFIKNINILNINMFNFKKKFKTIIKRLILFFYQKNYKIKYKTNDIINIKKYYFDSNKNLLKKKIIDKTIYRKFYL